jgi:hypothetical protein
MNAINQNAELPAALPERERNIQGSLAALSAR